ncbi:hypothetical protein BU26DRAFT_591433 [Trematosphaeria pertusa]|uniref:Uncharacterized protein n=1 Tax=Trematosphaeria pertusa TaxID=390896 RepID=A0A6A6ILZ7_9PLEO|nr:uncharacterized protein BU26DRAFT_591433 [Trematosphaeria pertusa]KAF2250560.1 hypothetical protein BU26DRAFT_591433 [Trematosphaeria pertusa]
MSTRTPTSNPAQAGSWANTDTAHTAEAQSAQQEWITTVLQTQHDRVVAVVDELLDNPFAEAEESTSTSRPSIPTAPSLYQPSSSSLSYSSSPDGDEEEFGPFQSASTPTPLPSSPTPTPPTNPFKHPIYLPKPAQDTDKLIPSSSHPAPAPASETHPMALEYGTLVAHGVIGAVQARFDAGTRRVRRAGKLALRKLQIAREKAGREAREAREAVVVGEYMRREAPAAERGKGSDVEGSGGIKAKAEGKEEKKKKKEKRVDMNGVVKPVSWGTVGEGAHAEMGGMQEEVDEFMEAEKKVWEGWVSVPFGSS